MKTESLNSKMSKKSLLRLGLVGVFLSIAFVLFAISDHFEWKLRKTIKGDFENQYPEYESVNYNFKFSRYRKAVTISYGYNNELDRELDWEYLYDEKKGWINYDSVMISRDTIVNGNLITIDVYKGQ